MATVSMNFMSKELDGETLLNVCFPDSTSISDVPLSKRKVLYLLHGIAGDASSWSLRASIENLVGKYGIVVVMPSVGRSMYCDNVNGLNYFSYVAKELPQYLNLVFGLSQRREDNFIAGNSMGGLGAMKIALQNPERFGGAGSFSGVLDLSEFRTKEQGYELGIDEYLKNEFPFMIETYKNLATSKDNPINLLQNDAIDGMKLYVSCGTEDKLIKASKNFQAVAKKCGREVKYRFDAGKHNWEYWSQDVREFLKYIME